MYRFVLETQSKNHPHPSSYTRSTRIRAKLQITRQNASYISRGGKVAQEADKVRQLGVVRVIEPGHHGNGVTWVEQV